MQNVSWILLFIAADSMLSSPLQFGKYKEFHRLTFLIRLTHFLGLKMTRILNTESHISIVLCVLYQNCSFFRACFCYTGNYVIHFFLYPISWKNETRNEWMLFLVSIVLCVCHNIKKKRFFFFHIVSICLNT